MAGRDGSTSSKQRAKRSRAKISKRSSKISQKSETTSGAVERKAKKVAAKPARTAQSDVLSTALTRTAPTRGEATSVKTAGTPSDQHDALSDGKLYYRIGEVAKITDVKPHVLRYWETEFRWMAPPKSRSKQRLYRRKDIDMILAIKRLLYEERYTIAGARQQLRDLGLAKALRGSQGAEEAAEETISTTSQGTWNTGSKGDLGEGQSLSLSSNLSKIQKRYREVRNELQAIRDDL